MEHSSLASLEGSICHEPHRHFLCMPRCFTEDLSRLWGPAASTCEIPREQILMRLPYNYDTALSRTLEPNIRQSGN